MIKINIATKYTKSKYLTWRKMKTLKLKYKYSNLQLMESNQNLEHVMQPLHTEIVILLFLVAKQHQNHPPNYLLC